MKDFLIILAIHLIVAVITFCINYKLTFSPYYVKNVLIDILMCLIPVLNVAGMIIGIYILFKERVLKNSLLDRKFNEFLNKKVK